MSDVKRVSVDISGWFTGLLFLLFLALRLTDQIDWAWYWVASPLWMPLALALVCFLVVLPIVAVAHLIDRRAIRKARERRHLKAVR